MQLVFTVEEFRVLVHLLRECEPDLRCRPQLCAAAPQLLEKLLARDFGFSVDELEDLDDILKLCNEQLKQSLAHPSAGDRDKISHRQLMLERLIDRVTEACAMA